MRGIHGDGIALAYEIAARQIVKRLLPEKGDIRTQKRRVLMDEAAGDAVFAEVPLLFEGGHEKGFDAVIVVMRGLQERVRAAAARDGCTEAEVQARVAGQFDYEKNLPCGHTVLYNDGDLAALEEKTGRAVHDILQKAGRESRGG